AMQVPFFRLFGVTWFALCLHAAVVNGLAAVAVYVFLRVCQATMVEAVAFAGLCTFFFYPPTGPPFTDQHSFFFMLLMFLAVAIGTLDAVRWRSLAAWFSVPILFTLGFLSSQIPTAFGAICVAAWLAMNPRRAVEWLTALAAGTLAVAAGIAILAI